MTKHNEAYRNEICKYCKNFTLDLGSGVCNHHESDHFAHYLHLQHPACKLFFEKQLLSIKYRPA